MILLKHCCALIGVVTGTVLACCSLYFVYGEINTLFIIISFTSGGIVGGVIGMKIDQSISLIRTLNKFDKE